jgi:PAS domain S-box-containing protein
MVTESRLSATRAPARSDGDEIPRRGDIPRVRPVSIRRLRWCALPVCAALAFAGHSAWAADTGAAASHYGVRSWQTDSGLPQNSVQAVVQTSDGHLWIGTKEGLARFNGVEFTVFNENNVPEITSASITALLEGPDGSLWIGTDGGGLVRLKGGRFQLHSTDAGLVSKRIKSLRAGPDGSVWIATTGGVNRFKDGRFTGYTDAQGLLSKTVRAMAVDRTGTLWIGTAKGTNLLREEKITVDPGKGSLKSNSIRALYEDREGALWVATNAELECRRAGAVTRYTALDGLVPDTVECIYQDRGGTLWVGTNDGLFRRDHGKFVSETAGGAFLHLAILTIAEDREGNVWIGTLEGVKQIRRSAFTAYAIAEGLTHNVVSAVAEDRTGVLWIGTMGGGLNRRQDGAFTVFRKADGLISDRISALHEGRDGRVWIGFDTAGLCRFEAGRILPYPSSAGAPDSPVNVIYEDRHGTVWFGTRSGLASFRDGRFTAKVSNLGGSGNIVRAITEDREGVLWIGSNHGITHGKDGTFTTLSMQEGLSRNSVTALYADREGVLWIGTDGGGLNWRKDGRFGVCTTRDGLFSDTALTILEDDRGTLWMSSRQGIFSIARQDLLRFAEGKAPTVDCKDYGKSDGLLAVEGSTGAKPGAWKARDGRLWFATVKGLHVVDPARLQRNNVPPPVVITRVEVNRNVVALDGEVRLPPGRGDLEFRYAALSFAQPEKIRYRYRLVGIDEDWVEAGARRIATYSGVNPGRHRFQVLACNNDGVWNRSGASCDFYLTPHFYETWWFYSLVAALVVGSAIGFYHLRMRTLRRREQRLAALVHERTKDLRLEIAERRRVEEALKGSEALYHSLVEILPVKIYRKDRTGRFTFANENFCAGARRPRAEIVGKTDSDLYAPEQARQYQATDEQAMATLKPVAGELIEVQADGEKRWFDFLKVAVLDGHGRITGTQGLFWDVTARKRAEEQVAKAQRELLDISRQAGMAEVATGVLHNVGNVLNSVNVSAAVVTDLVNKSKTANLPKICALLQEHAGDLANFLTTDPKGQRIPDYLIALAGQVAAERKIVTEELDHLRKNVEHIKDIVAMQQSYAKVSGVTETVALAELAEAALRMNATALARHGLTVVRAFEPGLTVNVERHKVLQILVNLLRNAKFACDDSGRADKQVTLRTSRAGDRVRIAVIDNGIGIPPENLTRIFGHGFTTRKNGHGFGLHSGALVAKELGGSLTAASDGPGRGAVFTLELPGESATHFRSAA